MAKRAKRYMAVEETATETSDIYKTALYARLSVDRNNLKSESIENQMEIIKNYIATRPEFKNYKEYVDKGYSGTTFNRPAFNELVADIKAGRINAIIVKDLSRFGRNDLETSNLLETILPFLQVRFISVNDNYDSADKMNSNKALELALKNLVNDMYAKDISQKIYSTRQSEMERGIFTGKDAPYGYKVDKNTRRFVVDPDAAKVVKEIYTKAAEGDSLRDIAIYLSGKGYTGPAIYKKTGIIKSKDDADCKWHVGTISNILSNKEYTGVLIQGKRTSKLFEGEKRHKQDESEWIIVQGTHDAIISEDEFKDVRKAIEERKDIASFKSDAGKRLKKKDNKYKKILKCGICGASLQMASEIRTSNGVKYRNYYYFCPRGDETSKSRACGVRLTEKVLDDAVYNTLLKTAGKMAHFDDRTPRYNVMLFKEKTEAILQEMENRYEKQRKILSQKMDGCKYEMAELYAQYSEGKLEKGEYLLRQKEQQKDADHFREEINELDKKYSDAKREVESVINWCKALIQGKKRKRFFLDESLLSILVKEIRVLPGHEVEIDLPIKPIRDGGATI